MIENIKPAESLTVADFEAHPVWEFLNDNEIGETMVRPVEMIPVETLDNRVVGTQVRLANGLEVWDFSEISTSQIRAPPDTSWLSRLNAVANGFTLRAIKMST